MVSVLPSGIVSVISALTVTLLLIVTSPAMTEFSDHIVDSLSSVAAYAVRFIPGISPSTSTRLSRTLKSRFFIFISNLSPFAFTAVMAVADHVEHKKPSDPAGRNTPSDQTAIHLEYGIQFHASCCRRTQKERSQPVLCCASVALFRMAV